jgi:hypothetical protein
MAKGKMGAPPRGPFTGKKRSFATKLTDNTMVRLEESARADGMSVSQKAEAAIIRGLDAQDDFRRHFFPALRAFEDKMIAALPARDETERASRWPDAANALTKQLSTELDQAIRSLAAEMDQVAPTAIAESKAPVEKAASGPRVRGVRKLDLD